MVVLVMTSKNVFHNEVYTYLVSLNGAHENLHFSEGKSTLEFVIFDQDPMLTYF